MTILPKQKYLLDIKDFDVLDNFRKQILESTESINFLVEIFITNQVSIDSFLEKLATNFQHFPPVC